jgi:adenylate kinase
MNLIILGPQGSGKGTQAKLLVSKLGLVYLEMGEVLRELASKKTSLGEKIASFQSQGKLVTDEIIAEVLKSFLTEENFKKGILFDGFPRTLPQANLLEDELQNHQVKIDKVIFLNISSQESLRRLKARRICPTCGANYNLVTMPPKNGELCDQCGSQLITRSDETDEAIKERLGVYQRETLPLIEIYRQKGILSEVNGEQSVGTIHLEILKNLGS